MSCVQNQLFFYTRTRSLLPLVLRKSISWYNGSQIILVRGRKRGRTSTTCIEDKEGNIIMEKEKILSRWYEYICKLYNNDRCVMPEIVSEVESPTTQREVAHALRGMPM